MRGFTNLSVRIPIARSYPLGVMLNELPLGTVLEGQTKHHTYHLENRGKGNVLISGHPTYCPEPVLVEFYGAGEGSPMFKFLRVVPGLRMEFRHPTFGLVSTSPVREIREVASAKSIM